MRYLSQGSSPLNPVEYLPVAKQRQTSEGSWPFALELFERGDPAFVDEIRRLADADRLGDFAARWFADPRPQARQLLFDYLSLPLNAFRHEALVKRLFKLAEKSGDDALMARFLVLFDRAVRRVRRKRWQFRNQQTDTPQAAEALRNQWLAEGCENASTGGPYNGRYYVHGSYTEEAIAMPPGTTMQRNYRVFIDRERLFSLPTRRYLRRRSWRYFRKLGKTHPDRYVPAVAEALKLYEDADVADGLALIDNWGLVHILFHHTPVLQAKRNAWVPVPGRALAELEPAPIYEEQWKTSPLILIDLLKHGRCRPVRQWAIFMLRRHAEAALQTLSANELFALLSSDDPAVVALAAEVLRSGGNLAGLGVDRLLALLEKPNPDTLEIICGLLIGCLDPEQASLEQTVKLATSRPLPVAQLGFTWLRIRRLNVGVDGQILLRLVEAPCEPLRPQIIRWLRGEFSYAGDFRPECLLEFLDSRHDDVRAEGLIWLREEPRARDDVAIWQKMLESPYDDVRLWLIADLEGRIRGGKADSQEKLNPDLLRFLWASALLNIHRGSRAKPLVVSQIVRRLERRPAEAAALLPILAVALRSVRGPEWRAGLAGIVQLVERNTDLAPLVRQTFPELKW